MKSNLFLALLIASAAGICADWPNGYDGRIRLNCASQTTYHSVRLALPAEADRGSIALFQAESNQPVAFQLNDDELMFASGRSELFVYFTRGGRPAPAPARFPSLVEVETGVEHQGQGAIRIRSAETAWIYHAEGAGFASLVDRQGLDWISYRPGNRSAGEFRGIPNLGVFAHPGYSGEKGSRTEILRGGPVMARIRSESNDGKGALVWDFWPGFATLTVERTGEPFWFLYEGTPAGRLDLASAYWGTPDGVRRSLTETWNQDLAGREWVYFGDTSVRRALFLINHQEDSANDQFYQMDGNMTVWGFGRQHRCCGRYLTAPARFTVGFADLSQDAAGSFDEIRRAVETVMAEDKVEVGPVEWKPKN